MTDLPVHDPPPDAHQPPSALVARWAALAAQQRPAGRRALDIAAGPGRNAVALVRAGYRVTAIDWRLDALEEAAARARSREGAGSHGGALRAVCADLTAFPLPTNAFDLIVVNRYLQRDLFPALQRALVRGGMLVYETFTERQRAHGRGPRSAAHLLRPGELRTRLRDLEILFDEEVTVPDALARIVARRRD